MPDEVTITGDCPNDRCDDGRVRVASRFSKSGWEDCPACNGTSYVTVTTTFGDILDTLQRAVEEDEEARKELADLLFYGPLQDEYEQELSEYV